MEYFNFFTFFIISFHIIYKPFLLIHLTILYRIFYYLTTFLKIFYKASHACSFDQSLQFDL